MQTEDTGNKALQQIYIVLLYLRDPIQWEHRHLPIPFQMPDHVISAAILVLALRQHRAIYQRSLSVESCRVKDLMALFEEEFT
ncbi:hypothetical protein scyTo_0009899 [Scyliorhinus torazame]|uniref:Uncharacterized protein n=1 Tax=Scyliorhinus torazame TaxID=75743 RepID=A0A401NVQ6_SCYTO|nr:hypothetical protein [Scyliorhinus torazame]